MVAGTTVAVFPYRAELDQSTPKNPLRLRHQTLHGSWLNSRAINLLGLEQADFKPPDGALLVRDASGRLSGLVVGMEEWLGARLPRVTEAELEARALAANVAPADPGPRACVPHHHRPALRHRQFRRVPGAAAPERSLARARRADAQLSRRLYGQHSRAAGRRVFRGRALPQFRRRRAARGRRHRSSRAIARRRVAGFARGAGVALINAV